MVLEFGVRWRPQAGWRDCDSTHDSTGEGILYLMFFFDFTSRTKLGGLDSSLCFSIVLAYFSILF